MNSPRVTATKDVEHSHAVVRRGSCAPRVAADRVEGAA